MSSSVAMQHDLDEMSNMIPLPATFLNNTAVSCYKDSDYGQALNYFAKALQTITTANGGNDPKQSNTGPPFVGKVAIKSSNEMNTYSNNSEERVMEIEKKMPSSDKELYIYERKEFDEGMTSFTETLTINEVGLRESPRQLHEALILYNMAQCKQRMENDDEANTLYRKSRLLLEEYQPTANIPLLIIVMNKIGQIQYFQGANEETIMTFMEAYNLGEERLGNKNLDILATTLNSLGVLYYHEDNQKAQEEAIFFFEKALRLRMLMLNRDHKDVATTLNNIGRTQMELEQCNNALATYQQVLHIRKNLLGSEHMDVAVTKFNIGQAYHRLDELDKAMAYYLDFLQFVIRKFGHVHRDVAMVLCLMGQIHHSKDEIVSSIQIYNWALEIGRASLGSSHPEIAVVLNNLGNCYLEEGNMDAAIQSYEAGLTIEMEVLDAGNQNIIATLINIGLLYKEQGKYDKAVETYQRLLEIQISNLRLSHPEVSSSILENIGYIQQRDGDILKVTSLDACQYVFPKEREGLNECCLSIAGSFHTLAKIHFQRGDTELSLKYFRNALNLKVSFLGEEHHDVALSYYNIALVHKWSERNFKALECCKEALRLAKVNPEGNRIFISIVHSTTGQILQKQGNLCDALKHFKEALRIQRKTENHVDCAKLLNYIGNIHLRMGDFVQMMEAFTESARRYRSAGISPDNMNISEQNPDVRISFTDLAPAA